MSNKYGLPEDKLKIIRKRDQKCVYCRCEIKDYFSVKGTPHDKATIEHLDNKGPFNDIDLVVYCCCSCNASRGNKELVDWFQTLYCKNKNINENSVAEPVKQYFIIELKRRLLHDKTKK